MSPPNAVPAEASAPGPTRNSADPRANFSWTSFPMPSPPENETGYTTPPQGHPAFRRSTISPEPDATANSYRFSELPGDMPPSIIAAVGNGDSNRSSASASPPPLDRQQAPWSVPSRPVSPADSVPPLPANPPPAVAKHVSVVPTPVPSRPTTPHRVSERGSVSRLNNMQTPRTQASMSEKPFRGSNLRPRAESGAPSYTSTTRPKSLAPTSTANQNFAQRVFDAAKSDLLYDLHETARMPWHFKDYKHGVLDLTTLQRMQQHVLQAKLVEQVKALGDRGMWMEIGIGETMKEYCQVTRDMEYMSHTSLRGTSADPFLITTTNPLESLLLEEGRLVSPRGASEDRNPLLVPRLPYMQRVSPAKRRVRRLLAVFAAAAALLAPYLIATLVPTLLARVITTCVCIALFTLAAAASSMSNGRAACVTLAYAAAVIIFIGLEPPLYWQ